MAIGWENLREKIKRKERVESNANKSKPSFHTSFLEEHTRDSNKRS